MHRLKSDTPAECRASRYVTVRTWRAHAWPSEWDGPFEDAAVRVGLFAGLILVMLLASAMKGLL